MTIRQGSLTDMPLFRASFVLLFLLAQFLAAPRATGTQPLPDWRDNARLHRELTLANGPDIYMEVARLFDQEGALEGEAFGWTGSRDLNWVWKGNPGADAPAFTLRWPKGTKVLEVMREIARRRSERLEVVEDTALIITPAAEALRPKTFQQKSTGASAELDKLMEELLVASIVLHAPDGGGTEEFLNHQFQRSRDALRALPGHENLPAASPFHVKMSAAARETTGAVNLLGWYTYRGLFDRISLCCGLRWHIDGSTVIFQTKDEEKRNGK